MKKVIFIFALALGFGFNVNAQSGVISAQNAEAIANYDGVAGRFEYALSATENMNVNYAITPKHPTSIAHFMIHTPEAMPFSAKVSDASGKIVYTWTPVDKVYLYNANWNVASWANGTYTVNVFMGADPKSIYNFTFTKQ